MRADMLGGFDPAEVRCYANPQCDPKLDFEVLCAGVFTRGAFDEAKDIITRWPGYAPTQLVALEGLARRLGLRTIWYKDEGTRFGLGSFKALGGAYAVHQLLAEHVGVSVGSAVSSAVLRSGEHAALTDGVTVTSATAGNHGRSVAWGAQQFGCRCVIYLHAQVSQGREDALRALGADVVRVAGDYDESVRRCAQDAEAKGRVVVSDTSWDGYRDIPKTVMDGYSVIGSEIIDALGEDGPSHVFVQGGVGGLAAAVCAMLANAWPSRRPRFVVVEPTRAGCLFSSAQEGRPTTVVLTEESMMTGLSCGEVSPVAWQVLARAVDNFVMIPEALVAPAMRLLGQSADGDPAIVAGESGVAGLAALIACRGDAALSAALGLDAASRPLLLGTEGATDPEIYQRIMAG